MSGAASYSQFVSGNAMEHARPTIIVLKNTARHVRRPSYKCKHRREPRERKGELRVVQVEIELAGCCPRRRFLFPLFPPGFAAQVVR